MPFSLDPMHPAQFIMEEIAGEGFQVTDLLAFTRRSTVVMILEDNEPRVLKVFFGSDHVLDMMDDRARARAYGFYWYSQKTDAERQFEIEAVDTEIEITGKMSGLSGWPTLISSGSLRGLKYMQICLVNGHKLNLHSRPEPSLVLQRVNWLSKAAAALNILHENDFVHRDVYHENIIVSEDEVTIIDLGAAKFSNKSSGPLIRGPEVHWPPEYLIDYQNAQSPADIFGIGVMLFRALTGDIPRLHSNDLIGKFATPAIKDLVMSCLDPRPTNRPTAKDVSLTLTNQVSYLASNIDSLS